MLLPILLTAAFAATLDHWVEPSIAVSSGERGPNAGDEGRIYAARGEREGLQIWVRARRGAVRDIGLRALPTRGPEFVPAIHRIGLLHGGVRPLPDPLLPAAPFDLGDGDVAGFWVVYEIPPDAKPGIYSRTLELSHGKKRKTSIPVRIEVFNFTLDANTLTILAEADEERLLALGPEPTTNESGVWPGLAAALAPYRISFTIRESPLGALRGASPELRAEAAAGMLCALDQQTLDIGAGGAALSWWPAPAAIQLQDPLQTYAHATLNTLAAQSRLERAVFVLPPALDRETWDASRAAYFRAARADRRVPRLLAGPPHPYFERYAEIRAIPFSAYTPELMERFRDGQSLRAPAAALASVRASSSGSDLINPGWSTLPEDAFDGSVYSAWRPAQEAQSAHSWIEAVLREAVSTDALTLYWMGGAAPAAIDVLVSYDGAHFSTATVRWEHSARVPFSPAVATARFKYPASYLGVRLVFRGGWPGGSLAEVLLGPKTLLDEPEPATPVIPWLAIVPDAFPSVRADAHPIETRLIPWLCWGHGFEGVYMATLSNWPLAWLPGGSGWNDARAGAGYLLYPAPSALYPSLRLERLRDGLDDYAYLRALRDALKEREETDPALLDLTRGPLYESRPPAAQLDAAAERIRQNRIDIGRALTRMAREKP